MRARNLKPGFFKNEELAELGPCAQLLFSGLWCLADREGKLEDRPKRIKAEIFPYYEPSPDVNTILSQLQNKGFLIRYATDGLNLIKIVNFKKHQTPHIRESASTYPDPEKNHCQGCAEYGASPCHRGVRHGACHERGKDLDSASHGQDRLSADSLTPDSLKTDSGIHPSGCVAGPASPDGDASAPCGEHCQDLGGENGVDAVPAADPEPEPPPSEPSQKTQPEEMIAQTAVKPKFCPSDLVALWNEVGCRPQVQKLTDGRRRKITARMRERADPDWWREFFEKVRGLQERGRKWLNIDWIIKNENNMLKVIEGNYDEDFEGGKKRAIAGNHQQRAEGDRYYTIRTVQPAAG